MNTRTASQEALETARQELESLLCQHPSIYDAVAMARHTQSGELHHVVYYVATAPLSSERLAGYVAETGVQCPLPTHYVAVTNLPPRLDAHARAELESIGVIDSELTSALESGLRRSGVTKNVAVLVRDSHLRQNRIHADPSEPTLPEGREDAPATGPLGRTRGALAVSDGGPLRIPADAPKTLIEALKATATAFKTKGTYFQEPAGAEDFQSYAELLHEARCALTGLRQAGLVAGDRAVLQLNSLREHYTTFWACVLGGIVPVTTAVSPDYASDSAATKKLINTWKFLNHPAIVVSDENWEDLKSALSAASDHAPTVILYSRIRDQEPGTVHESAPKDLAFIQLTSGSTGTPKCIQETHAGIIAHVHGSAQFIGYTSDDISLNWLAVDHVVPILTFHIKDVYLGCSQVQVPTSTVLAEPLEWLNLMEKYRVTRTWAPNFGFKLVSQRLETEPQRTWDLSCIKTCMNAGEQVTPGVIQEFVERLASSEVAPSAMQPAFGMAEVCTCMVYNNDFDASRSISRFRQDSLGGNLVPASGEQASVSFVDLGPPIPGVSIRIADHDDHPLPEGVIGRLQIKGRVVTPGYLDNPEANREAFVGDGWFNSGDLGFILDGRLTVTGREKEMINIRGANLFCYEIEDFVQAVDGVVPTYAAAVEVSDDRTGTGGLAILFVPTEEGDGPELLALLKSIRKKVSASTGINPNYVVPLTREAFPKTSSGKIQRVQMRKALESGDYKDILHKIELLEGTGRTLYDWFYEPVWVEARVRHRHQGPRGSVLVFGDGGPLSTEILDRLQRQRRPTILVTPTRAFNRPERSRFEIDPAASAHYERLFAEVGGGVDEIIHLWGTLPGYESADPQLFKLCSALARKDEPVRMVVVSSGTQQITAAEPPVLEKAALPVLVATLAQEEPGLCATHLDVDPTRDEPAALAAHICNELTDLHEPEVAIREGQRFVRRLSKAFRSDTAPGKPPFRHGGLYVITGALGGIGRHVTEFLVRNYGARVLLLGRRSAEEVNLSSLFGLPRERLLYIQADITDPEQMRAAVERAEMLWHSGTDGFIHLAGLYKETPLRKETAESYQQLLHPKVHGALAIDTLLEERPEAAFIAFSSVIGLFGGAQVGSYAAANRCLDALVTLHRHSGRLNSFSLAWSNWDDTGLSRGYHSKAALISRGYHAMPVEKALLSLEMTMRADKPHVLIGLDSTRPFIQRQCLTPPAAIKTLKVYYAGEPPVAGSGPHPQLTDAFGIPAEYELERLKSIPTRADGTVDREALEESLAPQVRGKAPASEIERSLSAIWREILNIERVGIDDNFFELGGNSLLIVQLGARIGAMLGHDVQTVDLFRYPTIAAIAAYLKEGTDNSKLDASGERGRSRRSRMNRIKAKRSRKERERVE